MANSPHAGERRRDRKNVHCYAYVALPLDNTMCGKVLGAVPGVMTAPQVFINGALIGSADPLESDLPARRLDVQAGWGGRLVWRNARILHSTRFLR